MRKDKFQSISDLPDEEAMSTMADELEKMPESVRKLSFVNHIEVNKLIVALRRGSKEGLELLATRKRAENTLREMGKIE